ncbi:ATP-binding protein [Actinacidiphila alni]|uniref:ATP-binding protein n=1 Tax=Actinacidiphila alni TaxID=380248 RepID=UPI003456D564
MKSLMDGGTSESERPAPAVTVCRPTSAAEARVIVSEFAEGLNPPVTARTAQNLLIVVSELVTNAFRHAGALCELRLSAAAHTVRAAVEDPSDTLPQGRAPDWSGAAGGFGWLMIQRLARTLTVVSEPGSGKTIMVTLAR